MSKLIDFHSHILPGIDDGSDCLETSLRMLERSGAQGISHVAATPHFYAHRDSLDAFLERRGQAERQLREAAACRGGLPEFSVGAEVYYFRGMAGSEALGELTLANTPYLLVEMPFTVWTDGMYRELEQIHEKQGITPVIAHVERYFGTFSTRGIPERLAELPVLVQSNAEFFLNSRTQGRALRLLQQGKIHLLGSDCHNLHSRCPNLGEAVCRIEKRLGAGALEPLAEQSGRILSALRAHRQGSCYTDIQLKTLIRKN